MADFKFRVSTEYIFAAAAVALLLGAAVALFAPRIKRVDLPYPGLPRGLEGFRIVQISDLHIGGIINRAYVERVVRTANGLQPDIVALTGDIADGDARGMRPAAEPLADLTPRGRVYYVSGNHEYYWNIQEWSEVFSSLGARILTNESVILDFGGAKLQISGVPDKMSAELGIGKPDLLAAIRAVERSDFKILLSHRPGIAKHAAKAGFDLQLSGHTHGGQFFPWTLVVRAVHEFHEGLRRVGSMWIYVSHGTGTWGPPLRLGTTPEVTLLTLKRELDGRL
jgi:predicted MPP superfamily phosphohydrolase